MSDSELKAAELVRKARSESALTHHRLKSKRKRVSLEKQRFAKKKGWSGSY